MNKIAIIGCGGINSWSVKCLKEIMDIYEKGDEMIYVKLFDNDVVEEKNLLRQNQNFLIEQLMMPKAEALGKRYSFDYECALITEENINILKLFTDVIMGVDNNKTRKLVYEFCLKHKIYLLDLKAQGTQVSYVVVDGKKPMEYYTEAYFANKTTMERRGGCQLEIDITRDHIENGNKIIATIGMYGIYLKRIRNEEVATKEWKWVY